MGRLVGCAYSKKVIDKAPLQVWSFPYWLEGNVDQIYGARFGHEPRERILKRYDLNRHCNH
jgi:hypothetical protein